LQREALHALCADCIGDDQGAKFNTLPGHVVSFRQAFGAAVAAGDPLGPRATGGASIREFAGLCRDNGIVPCVYQASPSLTGAYRAAGMRVIKFGEEAVVQLADYTLEGRRRANVRREVGRALRAGRALR
jgi:lysyl-tRNA synthetase class 2